MRIDARSFIAATLAALGLLLAACDEPAGELSPRRRNVRLPGEDPAAEDEDGESSDPTKPGSCEVGAPHIGFANTDFVADRKPGALGENRRRVKPFTAMRSEIQRVLGVVPAALDQSSAAFGEVPARWYIEPTAGAVSLYTTYTLAFSACYAAAETDCQSLQRKAWQRSPTPAETKACSDLALALPSEAPRRQWAHACASVLTSAGFTTF